MVTAVLKKFLENPSWEGAIKQSLPQKLDTFRHHLHVLENISSLLFHQFVHFCGKRKKSLKGHSKKRQSFDIKHLKKALEGSLRRLRTDYIDLYQLHSPPKEVLQNEDEEVFDFLNRIKKEGKIRFWGISLNEVEDGIICLKRKNISSFQIAFNFIDDEAQHVLFPNLNPDIGIIARVPFARGLLTEKKEVLTGFHDVDPQKNKKIKQKLESIQFEATKKEKGVSEVATEFILNHPEVTTAIIGTRSIEHLKANLKAFS